MCMYYIAVFLVNGSCDLEGNVGDITAMENMEEREKEMQRLDLMKGGVGCQM